MRFKYAGRRMITHNKKMVTLLKREARVYNNLHPIVYSVNNVQNVNFKAAPVSERSGLY